MEVEPLKGCGRVVWIEFPKWMNAQKYSNVMFTSVIHENNLRASLSTAGRLDMPGIKPVRAPLLIRGICTRMQPLAFFGVGACLSALHRYDALSLLGL